MINGDEDRSFVLHFLASFGLVVKLLIWFVAGMRSVHLQKS